MEQEQRRREEEYKTGDPPHEHLVDGNTGIDQ
jgi:hypothetical protein